MEKISFKAQEIKEYIANNLSPVLAKDGFQYKKNRNEFIYQKGDFKYVYNMLLTAWTNSYSLSVRLFIGQKKIEDIYKIILGVNDDLTFYQDMIERIYYTPDGRKIVKGEDLGIWLTQNDDLSKSIEILETYYEKVAKSYFSTFTTIEAFDSFMNNPPFEYSPAYVGSNTNERCMKGLIVAKLVNNPNYNQLVGIYDELIKKTVSDVQPDSEVNYNKVKEYLANNSIG